jgi:hypothetical protein
LLQQVNNEPLHDFLSQQNTRLFLSELMDLFVAGRDQSAVDQPNNLTLKVTPHCNHWKTITHLIVFYEQAMSRL